MKSDIRFLDTDLWQGIYSDGELILESKSQDIGELLMMILAEKACPNRTFKRLYITSNQRCPDKWTDAMEAKAK